MRGFRVFVSIVFLLVMLASGCGGETKPERLQAWDSHSHLHHHGEATHSHPHEGKHEHPWMKKGDASRYLPFRSPATAGKLPATPQ